MTFAEKLDFLMSMTKTSNNSLARYLALDTSYVSRMRSGKRLRPRNAEIIQNMAKYLTKRLTDDTAKKIVLDVMKTVPRDSFENTVAAWLARDSEKEDAASGGQVERFLNNLSGFAPKAPKAPQDASVAADLFSTTDEVVSVHYGVEGKRRAVELFLSEVALRDKPQTLMLHSSEEMSWMVGDPKFRQKWAALMFAVLSRGNRVIIIHVIDRGIGEMLDSIASWMPVYMTGLIEPYYYPGKRDNIFKQTMFIAPETSAIISHSVNDETKNAASILFRDKAAVGAYVDEFNEYLRMCRPLLRIFTGQNADAFMDALTEFEGEEADAIEKTAALSSLTMPKALFAKFLGDAGDDDDVSAGTDNAGDDNTDDESTGDDAKKMLDIHLGRVSKFKKLLKTHRYTEIISLPNIQKLIDGEVKADMSVLMRGGINSYTPKDYITHLQNIIALLNTSGNYHVHIAKGPFDDRYAVYCREDSGVIVAKTSQPPTALAASESQLVAAFWDFLKHAIGSREYDRPDNNKAAEQLRKYIADVKAAVKA